MSIEWIWDYDLCAMSNVSFYIKQCINYLSEEEGEKRGEGTRRSSTGRLRHMHTGWCLCFIPKYPSDVSAKVELCLDKLYHVSMLRSLMPEKCFWANHSHFRAEVAFANIGVVKRDVPESAPA